MNMINRQMIEELISGNSSTTFLKLIHTKDGSRVRYIDINNYVDIEFQNGDLILKDNWGRILVVKGSEWASKSMVS